LEGELVIFAAQQTRAKKIAQVIPVGIRACAAKGVSHGVPPVSFAFIVYHFKAFVKFYLPIINSTCYFVPFFL
jgi:hypothetical protein